MCPSAPNPRSRAAVHAEYWRLLQEVHAAAKRAAAPAELDEMDARIEAYRAANGIGEEPVLDADGEP